MGNPLLNMLGGAPFKMMNNPLMKMLSMFQNGGNPQYLIENMVSQNPQMKPIMNMIKGKNNNQLKETFFNMCKEKGVNPQELANQYNIKLPK